MLGKAYPSDTAIVEATVGRRREPPSQTNSSFPSARTTISNPVERYLAFSPLPARFNNPTHEYWSHVGCRKSLPAGQPHLFLSSYVSEANPSNRRARPPVGWRLSIPTKTLPFRLHLSDTVSLDLPSVAGESTPGQTTLPFLVPRWRRLPVQHSGYCAPVGRRREPHSETTYRFPLGRRD